MAISSPHFQLPKSLQPILPQGGRLLEIGEANWYGDIKPDVLLEDAADPYLASIVKGAIASGNNFKIAKAAYCVLFQPSKMVAVDYNGTPEAHRFDLNEEIHSLERADFDVVYNHGTAEHVFNVAQVFRTMHDHCCDGGLMIHEAPFTGWVDHGFYSLHPTLFYDLASANCYEVVGVWLLTITPAWTLRLESRDHVARLAADGELPNNCNLFVVLRKHGDRAFRVPMQGYYAGSLSPAGVKAWEVLR